jgi:hypothetical protein
MALLPIGKNGNGKADDVGVDEKLGVPPREARGVGL